MERFQQRYPERILETLLRDRTTGRNIIWADTEYSALGDGYGPEDEITLELISGTNSGVIKPRISKEHERQSRRTRTHAEVFTPSWLCNQMNNVLDEDWFRRPGTFNEEQDTSWKRNSDPIKFPKSKGKGWHSYVCSPRLEITCGEAPFVCSRYDTVTGAEIPVRDRIGILDRKLRVVSERTMSYKQWAKWALEALKATYGYEFQGDNLLVARVNVLETFSEHCEERWGHGPQESDLDNAAWVISWNIWQMDGLTCAVPTNQNDALVQSTIDNFDTQAHGAIQLSLFDIFDEIDSDISTNLVNTLNGIPFSLIFNWKRNTAVEFGSLKSEAEEGMKKFYAVIGNPPYQEETEGNGRSTPVYNLFMDAAYQVGDLVELITPGRFLFNAGQTQSSWNEKMLSDTHLKVLKYETNADAVFPGTDIKGGVAITLRNANENYGAIEVFTAFPELNSIIKKINMLIKDKPRMDSIIASQRLYKFSDSFFEDYKNDPNARFFLDTGTRNKILSSAMQKMPNVFINKENPNPDEVRFLGRIEGSRQWRCIKRRYIKPNKYLDSYKLFIPEANNSGKYGETLAEPIVGHPGEGSADTFLNAGPFDTVEEPERLALYYRTKFFRALLGARKVTQHSPSQVWKSIPLQDFSSSSDIDWKQTISDIDQQLYRKYGLSDEEIEFIETHVKEMD